MGDADHRVDRGLDAAIDKIRGIKGVVETFSTILLSSKRDRPE